MGEVGDTYARWAAGRCPCCGGEVCEWTDGTPSAAVGEGVRFCGRCMAMGHDEWHVVGVILLAIAERSDRAIDEGLARLG